MRYIVEPFGYKGLPYSNLNRKKRCEREINLFVLVLVGTRNDYIAYRSRCHLEDKDKGELEYFPAITKK